MKTFTRILVATDLSFEAEQALGHALYLAQSVGADVHLLHVMPERYADGSAAEAVEKVHERMERSAMRRLELTAQADERRDVMLLTRVVQGMEVVPAVLAYAERSGIDLIVMGTRGRRAKDRPTWQSHAEGIARAAQCPVLTVARDAWSFPGTLRRVLVPLELNGGAGPAIKAARAIAAGRKATVDLLHIITPNLTIAQASGRGRLVQPAAEEEVLARMKKEYDAAGGPEVRHQLHVRYGDPISEINNFARWRRSGMIVVSSQGATGITYALEGSSAAALVGTAPCPVLTLKNHTAATELAQAVAGAAYMSR